MHIFNTLSALKERSPCWFPIKGCIILSFLSSKWVFFSPFCFFKESSLLSGEVFPLPKKLRANGLNADCTPLMNIFCSYLRKAAFQFSHCWVPLPTCPIQPTLHQNGLTAYMQAPGCQQPLLAFIPVYLLTGIFFLL